VVGARKIEELILQLKKEMTVVVATHTPQMARRISDYVLFLYDGRVVEWGPKEVVLEAPENDLTKMYVAGRFG
jgi:phosphate transport system ATP-binding protein